MISTQFLKTYIEAGKEIEALFNDCDADPKLIHQKLFSFIAPLENQIPAEIYISGASAMALCSSGSDFLHLAKKNHVEVLSYLEVVLINREAIKVETPQDKLLTSAQAAEHIPMSLSWLNKSRKTKTGPDHINIGRCVFYYESSLKKWMSEL